MTELYDELVRYILEYQDKFYRIAYCYTYNQENALDIVQNAIVKALENYDGLRNKNAIKTWFYRILVNESLQYIKKGNKEFLSINSELKEPVYEEPAFIPGNEVFGEVMKLPEKNKTVILLHYYEDLTLKEIAKITNINENTVKTRLYSGLRKLKKMVKEEAI